MNNILRKAKKSLIQRQDLLNKIVHYSGVITLKVHSAEEHDKFFKINYTRKVCKWNPLTYVLYVPVIICCYIWDGGIKELIDDGLWISETDITTNISKK